MSTYPTVPTIPAGGLLHLSDVQAMYDTAVAMVQPQQIASQRVEALSVAGSGLNFYAITATTDTTISSLFDLGMVTDGRRALITFSPAFLLTNPSAVQVAIAEISLYVDGVKQANSVFQIQAAISSSTLSSNMHYNVITPVLTAAYHTFTMKARIVSGLSTPTLTFFTDSLPAMTVRAY